MHARAHSFTHSSRHLLIHAFIHSCAHAFILMFLLSSSPDIQSLGHPCSHLCVHSFTDLLICPSVIHSWRWSSPTYPAICHAFFFKTCFFFQSFFPPTPSLCSLSSCSSFICSLIHPPISGCICTVVCLFQLYSLRNISGFVYSSLFMWRTANTAEMLRISLEAVF